MVWIFEIKFFFSISLPLGQPRQKLKTKTDFGKKQFSLNTHQEYPAYPTLFE